MKIHIEKKYIPKNSSYLRNSRWLEKRANHAFLTDEKKVQDAPLSHRCQIHQQLDDVELDPHKLIKFIRGFVEEKNSYPVFLKSFDDFYAKPLLQLVPTYIVTELNQQIITDSIQKCYALCLLHQTTNWLNKNIDLIVNFEFEIKKLFMDLLFSTVAEKNIFIDYLNMRFIADVEHFAESYPDCLCSHTLLIDPKSTEHYSNHAIRKRFDLVHKFLSDVDFEKCQNIDKFITDLVISIQNNLRMINRAIEDAKLKDVPKYLWTQIFETFLSDSTIQAVLVDDYNNCVYGPYAMYNSTVYLYPGETNPNPVYKIKITNETYCVLCDADNPSKNDYAAKIEYAKLMPRKKGENGPYICEQICSKLFLHNFDKRIHSHKYYINTYYDLRQNFLNVRHTKNKILVLQCGYTDPNSIFSIFPKDIINEIIITLLDIIKYRMK